MSKRYTDEEKRDAITKIIVYDDIAFVQNVTGIPERTLRHWRQELREQLNDFVAEKDFDSATKRQQSTNSTTNAEPDDTPDHNETAQQPPKEPDNNKKTYEKDFEDLTFIREQLMVFARQMATSLRPEEPDSSRRTLALTRILDRIQWLDQILPGRIPEPQHVTRFEYSYGGGIHDKPPWLKDPFVKEKLEIIKAWRAQELKAAGSTIDLFDPDSDVLNDEQDEEKLEIIKAWRARQEEEDQPNLFYPDSDGSVDEQDNDNTLDTKGNTSKWISFT